MLVYVFVHRPTPGAGAEEYASRLAEFHGALRSAPPTGFVNSWVWQLTTGPLGAAFEDWYAVRGWAALGALNQAAVSGLRKAPHDRVAPLAAGGAGGIYELVCGAPTMTARYRTRIAKPAGLRYRTFQPHLKRAAEVSGALWKRQMVLGPDAEFLIDSPWQPDLGMFDRLAEVTELHPIYPSGS